MTNTARKVSKYRVFSGLYFPVFALNTGKYGPEKTTYLDSFHAVENNKMRIWLDNNWKLVGTIWLDNNWKLVGTIWLDNDWKLVGTIWLDNNWKPVGTIWLDNNWEPVGRI